MERNADQGAPPLLVIYGSQSSGVSSRCSRQVQLIFIHLDRLQNHHAFIDFRVARLAATVHPSRPRGVQLVWVLHLLRRYS